MVSSYLPEVGQSLSEFGDGGPAPFLDVDPGAGTFGVRPELLVDTFLQDCDPQVQAQAADHLARQSLQVTGQPVKAAAWRQVPSTYLVCLQDRAPRPGCSASSPAGPAASSNSTPATTRSCPSPPQCETSCCACDGTEK